MDDKTEKTCLFENPPNNCPGNDRKKHKKNSASFKKKSRQSKNTITNPIRTQAPIALSKARIAIAISS